MDYKYIEQLLERYWECQTTLEEEAILRTFFRQADVPARLLRYRQLFAAEDAMSFARLPVGFAEKVMRQIDETPDVPTCKARPISFMRRIRPLYQAAGFVALLLTIGDAAQQSLSPADELTHTERMAQQEATDSLQDITVGDVTQQSAALQAQPDSLRGITR